MSYTCKEKKMTLWSVQVKLTISWCNPEYHNFCFCFALKFCDFFVEASIEYRIFIWYNFRWIHMPQWTKVGIVKAKFDYKWFGSDFSSDIDVFVVLSSSPVAWKVPLKHHHRLFFFRAQGTMDFALHLNSVLLVQIQGKVRVVSIIVVFSISTNGGHCWQCRYDVKQFWPKRSFIWAVLRLNNERQ